MHSPPPFSARLHSGYTETAEGHLCYSETSTWGLRLFVGFIGLAMFCIPVPFVIHAHRDMPVLHLLLAAICVVVPVLMGLFLLSAAFSRPLRLCFDTRRRQMLRTSHWPLGRRDVPIGFDKVTLLDVLQRESEDGPYHLVRLGLQGERPMHLGSFDQRADAEYWRSRLQATLES